MHTMESPHRFEVYMPPISVPIHALILHIVLPLSIRFVNKLVIS